MVSNPSPPSPFPSQASSGPVESQYLFAFNSTQGINSIIPIVPLPVFSVSFLESRTEMRFNYSLECPYCNRGYLDLSLSLFLAFTGNKDLGIFEMTWWFNDGNDGGGSNNDQTSSSNTPDAQTSVSDTISAPATTTNSTPTSTSPSSEPSTSSSESNLTQGADPATSRAPTNLQDVPVVLFRIESLLRIAQQVRG
ncbi:hypothetical protein CPB86DRAFT_533689 [Serendipita vermifera]|nr:hypothetical protein CPB86DRAFT_533689 [Serendipita vermifera]